jgi:hypothetical protein
MSPPRPIQPRPLLGKFYLLRQSFKLYHKNLLLRSTVSRSLYPIQLLKILQTSGVIESTVLLDIVFTWPVDRLIMYSY